jgi:hypothetical protein
MQRLAVVVAGFGQQLQMLFALPLHLMQHHHIYHHHNHYHHCRHADLMRLEAHACCS